MGPLFLPFAVLTVIECLFVRQSALKIGHVMAAFLLGSYVHQGTPLAPGISRSTGAVTAGISSLRL
ncbi:hypothetical protein ACWIG5_37180 [Streptomyces lydicus]